jgi:hypothetical protein
MREMNGCLFECLDVRIRHWLLNPALWADAERVSIKTSRAAFLY